MSIMKAVYICILLSFIGACSHTRLQPKFSYYGTFCGPGKPEISANSTATMITKLDAMPAVDDLDWACKQHDICYARLGHNAIVCDELLAYLLDHWALPIGCNSIGYDIKAYFYRLHPSRGPVESLLNPIFSFAPKLLIDHMINVLDPPGNSPYVKNKQCFFDASYRRHFIKTVRKYGGPSVWGRPLPKNIREAKQKYSSARNYHEEALAAYDLALMYLQGWDGIRDEREAYTWFGKCYKHLACRIKRQMLEYKWQYIGEDDTEILRGSR